MVKTGVAFSDNIVGGRKRKIRGFDDSYKPREKTRLSLLIVFVFAGIIIIFLRLVLLQLIQGYYYKNLADNNRIKTIVIHAPRGTIFDRSGNPLVYNIPGYRETVNGKTKLLTQEEALSLIAKGKNDLEVDSLREYPYKDVFSHVLGYIGQISPELLKDPEFSDYSPGDLIGQMGLEAQYEGLLRGIDGKKLVEVDSLGKPIRQLGQTDPISGQNIETTLDINLQKTVFNSMSGVKKGAAIVTTPKGEILAMVSRPSFDPNLFTLGDTYKIASPSVYSDISSILLD